MRRDSLATALWLSAIALAIWAGGRISFDLTELAPGAWPFEAFVTRFIPGPALVLIGAFISLAALLVMSSRPVSLLPEPRLLASMFAVWVFIAISALNSTYAYASVIEIAKWSLYLLTMIGAVAICGRINGPRIALFVILGMIALLAATGVREYLQNAANEPGYRIFAGWTNPNALASILATGFVLGLALGCASLQFATARHRLASFIALSLASGIVLAAIWLTGSKGGILCAGIGTLLLLLLAAISKPTRAGNVLATTLVSLLFASTIVYAAKPSGTVANSRVVAFQSEGVQSASFRTTLWKESVEMIKEKPLAGFGAGAYAYAFQRFSSTEGSKLAHESWLQLAAESGVFAVLALLLLLARWFAHVGASHPAGDVVTNYLRIGVGASVAAAVANCFVESSLCYPGFGVVLFALLGLGLNVSADGARSDKLPASARMILTLALGAIVCVVFFLSSSAEIKLQEGIFEFKKGNTTSAKELFEIAKGTCPGLAPAHSWTATLFAAEQNIEMAIKEQSAACQLLPTSSNFIRLGDLESLAQKWTDAEREYKTAAELFPSSPKSHLALLRLFISQNRLTEADDEALLLVNMENSNYYKLRALAEYVYLDTIPARTYLAKRAAERKDYRTQTELLQGSFDIYEQYAKVTYRYLKRQHDAVASAPGFSEQEFQATMIGQQYIEALGVLEQLKAAAHELEALYRQLGSTHKANEIQRRLDEALEAN